MVNSRDELIKELLEGVQDKLRTQWREYRKQSYNPNTKGAAYEQALANLLEDYLGGAFDIRTRTAVLDDELACLDVFTPAENEIDVVASFQQSKPHIVFESEGMAWVPYNGVAFICEVKSELNSGALEDDLGKLAKLRSVGREPNDRFGTTIRGDACVDRQLLCLVYDEESISDDRLYEILDNNHDSWDVLLLVEEDILIINSNLPYSDFFSAASDGEQNEYIPDSLIPVPNGLLEFIGALSVSIPHPPTVSTIRPLHRLAIEQGQTEQSVSEEKDGK